MEKLLNQIKYNRAVFLFNKNLDKLVCVYVTLSIGHLFDGKSLFDIWFTGSPTNSTNHCKGTLNINLTDDIINTVCCGLDNQTIVKIIDERFNKDKDYRIVVKGGMFGIKL